MNKKAQTVKMCNKRRALFFKRELMTRLHRLLLFRIRNKRSGLVIGSVNEKEQIVQMYNGFRGNRYQAPRIRLNTSFPLFKLCFLILW